MKQLLSSSQRINNMAKAEKTTKGKKEDSKSSMILFSPKITEKSTTLSEKNKYTFNVATNATKNEIKKEVKRVYGVVPLDVNIIVVAPKSVFVRGRYGVKGGGKKAVITLKKGDSIPLA
jgi:large subunit ribosomal protein L23